MGIASNYLLFTPYRMKQTPIKIQNIFDIEILSANPINPIDVVNIKINGPTKANILFTTNAFSILFNFKIMMATKISIVPEKNLNNDMPIMALSKN